MSKDKVIEWLIQEGRDPDRVRREVDLADVAWNVEPDGWEVSDLWFLRARLVCVCCVPPPVKVTRPRFENESHSQQQDYLTTLPSRV